MSRTSRNFRISRIMIALICCVALVGSVSGCGGNELQSLTLTISSTSSSTNLAGIGDSLQLQVLAHYSNTSILDETTHSTYTIAPPNPAPVGSATFVAPAGAVTVNASGIVQDVQGACTWTNAPIIPPATTAIAGTNPYIVSVTYGGMTATQFVSVSSIVNCPQPTT